MITCIYFTAILSVYEYIFLIYIDENVVLSLKR